MPRNSLKNSQRLPFDNLDPQAIILLILRFTSLLSTIPSRNEPTFTINNTSKHIKGQTGNYIPQNFRRTIGTFRI